MLHLHTGNRLEDLADAMFTATREASISPLANRTVLCESGALGAWLRQRLAREQGIACLFETPLPASWLWAQARRVLGLPPGEDPLDRERLTWRLLAAFGDDVLMADAAMATLRQYLAHDQGGLRRWQLAQRLADAFDRYQYHRPGLIREWTSTEPEDWQGRLWRRVSEGVDMHRVALMDAFLDVLANGRPDGLPPRLDLFSIHNLPPLLMQAITRLAEHLPVHLWLFSPSPEYWADLETPKRLARQRLADPQSAALWQAGNPLLTQWGRQGQAFQDLLLDDSIALGSDSEHFQAPERDSLLHRVQADIHAAVDPRDADTPPETIPDEGSRPSIQFHVCHGPLRECQVLHDTLLHLLKENKTLEPEDILVMAPEIDRYAPYIDAVFGSATDNTRLPFHVADALHPDEHPLIQAFLELLDLPQWRFSRTQVLGLLDIPEVRARFDLQEADIAELGELFQELRIYWGLDAGHRKTLGLPALDDHGWQQGLRRIMAGLAAGDEPLLALGEREIAPAVGMAARRAERAAAFFELLQILREQARRLHEPTAPKVWAERLRTLLDALFRNVGEDSDRLDRIREALAALEQAEQAGLEALPSEIVRHYLAGVLGTGGERSRLFRRGVTFCALRPLRGIPFRVIALLGMQEDAFPRRARRAEFDRMKDDWRHGDPDPTLEDRYLFLETVLAARDYLVISYSGRDPRRNEALEPSVVVRELTDYLDSRYQMPSGPPSACVERVYPPHPFSPRNFILADKNTDGRPQGLQSFDRQWFAAARIIQRHEPPITESGWPEACLAEPRHFSRDITPEHLARFFRNPIRQFVQQRLHLFEPEEDLLAEDEPLSLDKLQEWDLVDLLLDGWLRGRPVDDSRRLARARGLLPHGPTGERALNAAEAALDAIRQRCREQGLPEPLEQASFDLDLPLHTPEGRWRLAGRIRNTLPDRSLLELHASKYGLDKLLPSWIRHLCLQAAGVSRAGLVIFRDKTARFAPLAPEEAKAELVKLLQIMERGLLQPLALPPKSAATCADTLFSKEDEQAALNDAKKKWHNGNYPESEDYYCRNILHGHDWSPDERLIDEVEQIFPPMQNRLETTS